MGSTPEPRSRVKPLPGRPGLRANGVWAPFEKGNQAARKHGAYSQTARLPRVMQLVSWVLSQDALAHISDESFRPALFRWAERQAMADLMFTALEEHHRDRVCPGCKQCRGWEERWARFDRSAERAGAAIGLDPESRATLLERMNSAGLLNLADEASSMLGDLFKHMQRFVVVEEYVDDLVRRLEAAGLPVPEMPSWGDGAESQAGELEAGPSGGETGA